MSNNMEKELGEIVVMEDCINLHGLISDASRGNKERAKALENIVALYGAGFLDDTNFVRIVKAILDEDRDTSKVAVSSNLMSKAVMVLEALA